MNRNFNSFALLFLLAFFISTSNSSARKLAAKQGEADEKINSKESVAKIANIESSYVHMLMGLEECLNEDEDCLKRRIVSEVHLDYIYTQHHKP